MFLKEMNNRFLPTIHNATFGNSKGIKESLWDYWNYLPCNSSGFGFNFSPRGLKLLLVPVSFHIFYFYIRCACNFLSSSSSFFSLQIKVLSLLSIKLTTKIRSLSLLTFLFSKSPQWHHGLFRQWGSDNWQNCQCDECWCNNSKRLKGVFLSSLF